jgi:AmmeMemoRadiSam system protein B
MLDRIEAMDAEAVVPEARARQNACGAGAIAATLAAVKPLGATQARLLNYTNSYRIIHERYGQADDDTTVGYASAVFA